MKKLMMIAFIFGIASSPTFADTSGTASVGEDSKVDCTKIFEGTGTKSPTEDSPKTDTNSDAAQGV